MGEQNFIQDHVSSLGTDSHQIKMEMEKTEFDAVLTSVGDAKLRVIKVVRDITNLGLKDTKELADEVPSLVKQSLSKSEAEGIKLAIEAAGGGVEICEYVRNENRAAEPIRFGTWQDQVPDTGNLKYRLEKIAFGKYLAPIIILVAIAFSIPLYAKASFLSGMSYFLVQLVAKLYRQTKTKRAPDYLARLIDLPMVTPTFPVSIQIRYDGNLCGIDDGVVSIQDGYLHFEGIRGSFGLRSTEFAIRAAKKFSQVGTSIPQEIYAKVGEIPLSIIIEPYDSLRGVGTQLSRQFKPVFVGWSRTRCEDVAHSTFPPVVRSALMASGLEKQIFAWLAISLLTLISVYFLGWIPWLSNPAALGLGIALVGIVDLTAISFKWKQFRGQSEEIDKIAERLSPYLFPPTQELRTAVASDANNETRTDFDVVLTSAGEYKLLVIKAVREVTGLGLKDAIGLVDNAPSFIKQSVPREEAKRIRASVEAAGGSVNIR